MLASRLASLTSQSSCKGKQCTMMMMMMMMMMLMMMMVMMVMMMIMRQASKPI